MRNSNRPFIPANDYNEMKYGRNPFRMCEVIVFTKKCLRTRRTRRRNSLLNHSIPRTYIRTGDTIRDNRFRHLFLRLCHPYIIVIIHSVNTKNAIHAQCIDIQCGGIFLAPVISRKQNTYHVHGSVL